MSKVVGGDIFKHSSMPLGELLEHSRHLRIPYVARTGPLDAFHLILCPSLSSSIPRLEGRAGRPGVPAPHWTLGFAVPSAPSHSSSSTPSQHLPPSPKPQPKGPSGKPAELGRVRALSSGLPPPCLLGTCNRLLVCLPSSPPSCRPRDRVCFVHSCISSTWNGAWQVTGARQTLVKARMTNE